MQGTMGMQMRSLSHPFGESSNTFVFTAASGATIRGRSRSLQVSTPCPGSTAEIPVLPLLYIGTWSTVPFFSFAVPTKNSLLLLLSRHTYPALPIPDPWRPLFGVPSHNFVIWRMLYKWNLIVCNFLRLTLFVFLPHSG